MNPEKDFMQAADRLARVVNIEAPLKAKQLLAATIDDSFTNEEYKPKASKWAKRKKDKDGAKPRDKRRGLLVKSGDLRRDVTNPEVRGSTVAVGSDLKYAKVHNEGGKAGRGKGFSMPQRQFMPIPGEEVPEVTQGLETFLTAQIDKIMP